MINTVAIANYRSLLHLVILLGALHPDLLPALARLIIKASQRTQVWVVSHATRLIAALEQSESCHSLALEKELGQTIVTDQGMLDEPLWRWPDMKK